MDFLVSSSNSLITMSFLWGRGLWVSKAWALRYFTSLCSLCIQIVEKWPTLAKNWKVCVLCTFFEKVSYPSIPSSHNIDNKVALSLVKISNKESSRWNFIKIIQNVPFKRIASKQSRNALWKLLKEKQFISCWTETLPSIHHDGWLGCWYNQ